MGSQSEQVGWGTSQVEGIGSLKRTLTF